MSEEQKSALQRASDLANSGNYSEALEISRSILVADPTNANAKLVEAISLSQLGSASDASEAFAEAVELDPKSARIRFNAAVHELNTGNYEGAKILAQSAIDIEPTHMGAKDLLARITDTSPPTSFATAYPREKASDYEPEYAGIPMIDRMGSSWNILGVCLGLLSLAMFALSVAVVGRNFQAFMDAASSQNQGQMRQLMGSLNNPVLQVVGWILPLGLVAWMIMDILHRRRSWAWVIGHIPLSCCGLGFITQFAYMIFGRK